ncbi:MAG: PilZ domain-containing protein [Thermomonas sp.]|uniref:PilZ domain-containing protein n=1 Tax=Thermomonas sp. TaxID=1971895 RepID=UPI0039E2A43F
MGIEARRQPRRAVPGMVDVFDTITEQTVGYLGNLSVGGMLLIANRALVDDALYQFRFILPDEVGAAQPLETGAHVLWQDAAGAPGQHWIGLRFLGLSADATGRLRRWAEQAPNEPASNKED